MPRIILLFLVTAAAHGQFSLLQETSAQYQFQTVQAATDPSNTETFYIGSYQISQGLGWTVGASWYDVTLRGGLTARKVSTSPVVDDTVYPGYQGWGTTIAVDYTPFHLSWGGLWSFGGTAAFTYEYMSYPGLFREFELPDVIAAPLAEWTPEGVRGLSLRFRVPFAQDFREGFYLTWRAGLEAAVVFRGGWGEP